MKQTLDTLPGAIFSYSNEGVQLLAPIIERACGMEVEACFKICDGWAQNLLN